MSEQPSPAEVRQVLRDNGRDVGKRGNLSARNWEDYHDIMDGAGGDFVTDIGDPDPPPHPSTHVDESSSGGVEDEQRPRRVSSRPTVGDRIRDRWQARDRTAPPPPRGRPKGKGRKPKGRPERPWVPTAGLIQNTWERLAQAASGIPPLQRVLAAQGVMAGDVLEGALRESLVDRFLLQPAARAEQRAEAVSGMVGVPVLVTLLAFRGQVVMGQAPGGAQEPVLKPDGSPMWTPATEMTMVAPLRYCLVSWLSVSERYADQVIERAEATVRKGEEADKIIAWIFGARTPGMSFEDLKDEARDRAEEFMRSARPAPPDPARRGGSTAFRPAITGSVLPP